jgi:ribosomal protein L5
MANATTNNLQPKYKNELRAKLQKDLNLRNIHQVPEISKITLNVGLGKSKDDKRMKETAANTLRKITGQEPVETFRKEINRRLQDPSRTEQNRNKSNTSWRPDV